MSCAAECPYFQYEKQGITYCECGELRFPDKEARRDIVYGFCAHPDNYQHCPFKCMLDRHYERRFS